MYKKLPFCIFAVLLVCFASTLAFAEGYKKDISTTIVDLPVNFKNVKTIRTVDLRSTVVREDIGIRAENIDNQPQNEYYVPLPEEYDNKVAHFTAALKTASKEALPVEKIGFDSTRYILVMLFGQSNGYLTRYDFTERSKFTRSLSLSLLKQVALLPSA
jgi:hypothetical protein